MLLEDRKEKYKFYEEENIRDLIPQIKKEGRKLMSLEETIKKKVEIYFSDCSKAVKDNWLKLSFNVSDCFVKFNFS